MKLTMLGGGSWGTTLSQLLSDNGHNVLIYDINKDFVKKINDENIHPFFNVTIPSNIKATSSLKEAVDYSDVIILCVPTKFMRSLIEDINKLSKEKKLFINTSKGIEPDTSKLISQIVDEVINKEYFKGYVTLSGPSHAEELIERKITVLTAASTSSENAEFVQSIFNNDKYARIYTSSDVIGVETGASIKNAIAVISGIASGLGYGENARAALIARGLRELVKIVEVAGGKKETAYGLSGVGDLIVTASSLNSRNFQAGLKIGKGQDVQFVVNNSKMAVEGIRTLEAAYNIGKKHNIELPILEIAYQALFNKVDINEAVKTLLTRQLKEE